MVVIWYAPNIQAYDKFAAMFLDLGNDFGTTETQPVMSVMSHVNHG